MSFSESPVRRPACAAMLPLLSWDVGLLKDTDCTAQPNHVMLASSTSFSLQRTFAMQIQPVLEMRDRHSQRVRAAVAHLSMQQASSMLLMRTDSES